MAEQNAAAVAAASFGLRFDQRQVRTSGETRISNFLLWQISYAELWVTEKCWPEFDRAVLHQALREFAGRERRFGGIQG